MRLEYTYGNEPGSFDLDGFRFVFYREHFDFGKYAAYRTNDGAHFRFLDRGDVLTGNELADRLRAEIDPSAMSRDHYWKAASNYAMLRSLPA